MIGLEGTKTCHVAALGCDVYGQCVVVVLVFVLGDSLPNTTCPRHAFSELTNNVAHHDDP